VLRLAADENFNNNIVRGLLRRKPDADFVRVQDVGLSGADDPTVLEWAAEQGRAVVSHDVSTLRKHAYDRVAAGLKMPGVFEVPNTLGIGRAIDDLLLIVECSLEGEWKGQVRYLPL
jgi:hypothetical protein